MANLPDLHRAATLVVRETLNVRPAENVVVVTDPERSPRIAQALMDALRAVGAEAVLATIFLRPGHKEPPPPVQAAIERAHVVLTPTTVSMTYTDAVLDARRRGARVITMPLISEAAFARVAQVDLAELGATSEAVAERLAAARSLHLWSPLGTDLHVQLGDNPVDLIDGRCREPGEYEQVPPGVVSVLAVATDGVLVADASCSPVGSLSTPIRFEVRDSRIRSIDGGAEARLLQRALEEAGDENVYHCAAEVGVGTNRWARYVAGPEFGTEGARVSGWVHVGFGDNHTMDGGNVRAPLHNDALLTDCRLTADGLVLADAGRLLLEDATR
jgi:leucyl aminopeptidase (aminopeptidase T)